MTYFGFGTYSKEQRTFAVEPCLPFDGERNAEVEIAQTGVNRLSAQVDGYEVPISEIAKNDGLNSVEFAEFLRPILKTSEGNETTFAVIHFTDFRY